MILNKRYAALMHDVCAGHGWCGGIVDDKPRHVDDFIPEQGPVKVDQFVDWIFMAEGMDPYEDLDKWQKHKDALRALFIRHMGGDCVDARCLNWFKDE